MTGSNRKQTSEHSFDKAYYDRYYRDPSTRVSSPQSFIRQADFVCSYVRYLEQPVRRVIDLGCGTGRWQEVIHRHFPKAKYAGVEVSDYLCEQFGWRQGSVVDYASNRAYDLVICQDVIQYLSGPQARQAIDNLAELCRGVMYFTCLTEADWLENCDQKRTDGNVQLRSATWYRKRLKRHFINAGGGVYIRKDSDIVMFELDCLE